MSAIDHLLLMSLMETSPDRIYFKDREARFISVNKAMKDFLGVTCDDEIIGKTDHDFFLPDHADDALADEKQVLATGESLVAKVEQEDQTDGRVTWVSTTKIPMRNEQGEIIGTCGISRDVTEEHRKNEKLVIYSEELAQKQAQMEQELASARQIQFALLPQRYPVFPPEVEEQKSAFQFAHFYLPSGQIGGDFFTILPVSKSKAGVLICDVMGHGVHAALVTAVQRILVDDLRPWSGDPGVFLREMNRRLCEIFESVTSPLFVTAFYMVVDSRNGEVRFANAGHPHPLHLRRETGEVRILGGKEQPTAFALGVAADSSYETQTEQIYLGDRILLFTDGLCDFEGESVYMRDDYRFLALVQACMVKRGNDFLNSVVAQVKEFAGGQGFFDDVCLVSIEWERLWQDHFDPSA